MRFRLRWKILLLTVLAPVTLALATLWTVNRSVSRQMHSSIHESLRRSSSVFENMLAGRLEALEVAALVIVRDPRFFSMLTLPGAQRDPRFLATVRGVARDFNTITHADLFEVMDRRGGLLTSVGRASSTRARRQALVRAALRGPPVTGILVESRGHYQVAATPVFVDRRVAGVLLLGAAIGEGLARELRELTRSEVTFLSDRAVTGSTFASVADRRALLAALERPAARGPGARDRGDVFEVRAPSQTYLTLVRPLPGSDPEARQLYAMQRSLDTETAFLTGIRAGLVQLGMLAVAVALLMGFMISEHITRPVRELVRAAEEMQRGNYDHPIAVASRDEMGYLADRFQEMRQREHQYVTSLEEAARLKSEFINVASHELRTPISVIQGFQDLFAAGSLGPITDRQRQALEAIGYSLTSLTRIADNATRMAQIESERLTLSLREHAVPDIVEEGVRSALAEGSSRDLQVTIDIEPQLPPARVDGVRLVEAVAHLVRNAIRFTPDGGAVDVRADRDGDRLVIRVKDTGIGIAAHKRRQLFSRTIMVRDSLHHHSSHTLEFNSAGLGLGLPIVRGIVEAHGGSVAVESRPGQGSTFTVRVPLDGTGNAAAA